MSRDLWSFKNANELKRETKDMPDVILKEQIALLSDKTDGILYGRPNCFQVKTEEIEYNLATMFEVVAPNLDNYATTILILYSNPETEYPLAITVGSSPVDDVEDFLPKYTCKNKEEFINSISAILSSEEVTKKIGVLYSKAITVY